jgi:hypothetical protein
MGGTGGAAVGTGGTATGTGGAAGSGGTSGAAGGASGIAGTGSASGGGTGGAAGGPAGTGGTTVGPFGKLSFLAPVNYPAGRAATAGTDVADLNGDGSPDVVTGGLGINILLNNEDGTLAAPVTYRATTPFGNVACGDMNGDGKPDIVAADATSVSVFINAGNGTFAAAPITHPIDTGSSGSSYLSTIALGDVNGDGKLDLAAAVNASSALDGDGKVSVHLNDGTGRLTQAFNRATDAGLVSIAIGDLNGDGKPDLAAAGDSPGAVDALINTGNTTFAPAVRRLITGSWQPISVAIGDLNGDSYGDLIVGNAPGRIDVLLNDGAGSFAAAVVYGGVNASGDSRAVALPDLNGDGRPDVAIAEGYSVAVFMNGGDGRLAPAVHYPAGQGPGALAVADFNRDGRSDLVAWNASIQGSVAMLLNQGDGRLGAATAAPLRKGLSAACADLDGDGRAELVFVDSANALTVLWSGATEPFATATDVDAGGTPAAVAVGDFDGDGRPDLAVAVSSGGLLGAGDLGVLLNLGNRTFAAPVSAFAGATPFAVAAADLNGDGVTDLVVGNQGSDDVSVFLNMGQAQFAAPVNYPAHTKPIAVVVADANRDGRPDLIVGNSGSGDVSVLLNAGAGTFAAPVHHPLAQENGAQVTKLTAIAAADINGDGALDLAVTDGARNTVILLRANGAGGFDVTSRGRESSTPDGVALADLDGDGRPEMIVANHDGADVSVFTNIGGGSLASEIAYAAGGGPTSVAIGDLNGDGKLDFATTNDRPAAGVGLFLNTSR